MCTHTHDLRGNGLGGSLRLSVTKGIFSLTKHLLISHFGFAPIDGRLVLLNLCPEDREHPHRSPQGGKPLPTTPELVSRWKPLLGRASKDVLQEGAGLHASSLLLCRKPYF